MHLSLVRYYYWEKDNELRRNCSSAFYDRRRYYRKSLNSISRNTAANCYVLKMTSEANILSNPHVSAETAETLTSFVDDRAKKEKFQAVAFLSAVTGISVMIGFGTTLVAVRKQDPKSFNEGVVGMKGISETGASLALRALGWGTFYACTGCGIIFYSIWKLSGATSLKDFRYKMGSLLPKIPKNDPPQSRTEFKNLTDLLKYISEDWGKQKTPKEND